MGQNLKKRVSAFQPLPPHKFAKDVSVSAVLTLVSGLGCSPYSLDALRIGTSDRINEDQALIHWLVACGKPQKVHL